MNIQTLHETIEKIFQPKKGVLAADESPASIHKRFEALGIPLTEENRLGYRTAIVGTPNLSNQISGIIFQDETFRQTIDGKTFAEYCTEHGIVPGIKVDKGLIDLPNFPGEKLTLGLDGLKERMEEYYALGARFCKWRAVVDVHASTEEGIAANMRNLALYASIAQQAGIVPMVEPEVLYDGTHFMHETKEKMLYTLTHLFGELALYKVDITGVILKTSMVLPGLKSGEEITTTEVAHETALLLRTTVPKNIGGVVFLSGGQQPIQASENLSEIMKLRPYDFPITYSYSRAIQDPVLAYFSKHISDTDLTPVRNILVDRLDMNTLSLTGEYEQSKETGISAHVEKVTGSQDL
ncbi:MAG: class I fructose-bisphosphate aldolase [Patescibacteria group bacterium]